MPHVTSFLSIPLLPLVEFTLRFSPSTVYFYLFSIFYFFSSHYVFTVYMCCFSPSLLTFTCPHLSPTSQSPLLLLFRLVCPFSLAIHPVFFPMLLDCIFYPRSYFGFVSRSFFSDPSLSRSGLYFHLFLTLSLTPSNSSCSSPLTLVHLLLLFSFANLSTFSLLFKYSFFLPNTICCFYFHSSFSYLLYSLIFSILLSSLSTTSIPFFFHHHFLVLTPVQIFLSSLLLKSICYLYFHSSFSYLLNILSPV